MLWIVRFWATTSNMPTLENTLFCYNFADAALFDISSLDISQTVTLKPISITFSERTQNLNVLKCKAQTATVCAVIWYQFGPNPIDYYENLAFHIQFKIIFISLKSLFLFCWDIQFFFTWNHSINLDSCDVMASISTQGRVHFWMYLLNCKALGHETFLGNALHNLENWALRSDLTKLQMQCNVYDQATSFEVCTFIKITKT